MSRGHKGVKKEHILEEVNGLSQERLWMELQRPVVLVTLPVPVALARGIQVTFTLIFVFFFIIRVLVAVRQDPLEQAFVC